MDTLKDIADKVTRLLFNHSLYLLIMCSTLRANEALQASNVWQIH